MQQPAASLQTIARSVLDQLHGIVLDTRDSAYFNGWPEAGAAHGGHEPGAISFAASWLDRLDDAALSALLKAKAIYSDRPLALYGSAAQVAKVSTRFGQLGFRRLYQLDVSLSAEHRVALPRYHQLVPAFWLCELIAGKSVVQAPAHGWKVMEVGWGDPGHYLQSHIPGAGYLNTNLLETEPLWNTVANDALRVALLEQGIGADTPVILYGREPLAAARVAHILLYAGVKDVRLLDGGWNAWSAAGYRSAAGLPAQVRPLADFGSPFPGQPELMVSLQQTRRRLKSNGERLVSIRSWQEFIGKTSGYSYIEAMGDIPGAAWGHAGSDANHMQDFRNPDHTMRSANEIAAIWREVGIMPTQRVVFYCGTGWRASEAFFSAWVMGWQNISVFDGGWLEWSLDPSNPIVTGERPAG